MSNLLDRAARILYPDGTSATVFPLNGEYFTLEELYGHLDCETVEVLICPGQLGAIMIIDEEGKLKNRPINTLATVVWQEGADEHDRQDFIVGPVLLCRNNQLK